MWALTTSIRLSHPIDPYTDRIYPITGPRFLEYAKRHGMDYRPCWVDNAMVAQFIGHIPTRGTEPVYASIPFRRYLLDHFDGVLYLDEDAVILDRDRDICAEVTDERPIGMAAGLSGALQVLKSTDQTKLFLDTVWDMRHDFKRTQWAEEGAMKELLGWDPVYRPERPVARFVAPTTWTPLLRLLDHGLLHPLDPSMDDQDRWFAMNPGGVWPFEKRLALIEHYAASDVPGG